MGGKPEDPLTVMKRIVDRSWNVSFPVYLSEEAVDIMSWFMERRSAKRLGNLRRKANDIRTHPWFAQADFDWETLRTGALKPKPLALSEAFTEQLERSEGQVARRACSVRDDEQCARSACEF